MVLLARGWIQRHRAPRLQFSQGLKLKRLAARSWRVRCRPALVGLRSVAVALLAIALMGPQSIHARNRSEVEGIDIVLALDVSLSMEADDITPNRFRATQAVVDHFIRRRPNDRIGAVIFGREAYTLLPLTSDKEALRRMIQELELNLIEGRGTAIGNAVGLADGAAPASLEHRRTGDASVR